MKKSILFVKVKSRLGLINPPKGRKKQNIGVEEGPDYILSKNFINLFPSAEEIVFKFSDPEQIERHDYYEILAKEYQQLIKKIGEKYKEQTILVTVGGDHSISLGSVSEVLNLYDPLTTGVIMIDSHGDIHQPATSPSDNFHGMWLRPVVDSFQIASINNLVIKKLPMNNLIYIGNLDIEKEEKIFIKNNAIYTFNQSEINTSDFRKKLSSFIKKMCHIHLSIDIDAFCHAYAPATGMMVKNGLKPSDVFPILNILKDHESLSVDLVEVNPIIKDYGKTIQLAQEILLAILK